MVEPALLAPERLFSILCGEFRLSWSSLSCREVLLFSIPCRLGSGLASRTISSKLLRLWFFNMDFESLIATSGLQLRCLNTWLSSKLLRFFSIPCFLFVIVGSTTLGLKVTGGVLLCVLVSSLDIFLFSIETGPSGAAIGVSTITILLVSSTLLRFRMENGLLASALVRLGECNSRLAAISFLGDARFLLASSSTLAKVSRVNAASSSILLEMVGFLYSFLDSLLNLLLLSLLLSSFLMFSLFDDVFAAVLISMSMSLAESLLDFSFGLDVGTQRMGFCFGGSLTLFLAFSMWMLSSDLLGVVVDAFDAMAVVELVETIGDSMLASVRLAEELVETWRTSGGKNLRRRRLLLGSSAKSTICIK